MKHHNPTNLMGTAVNKLLKGLILVAIALSSCVIYPMIALAQEQERASIVDAFLEVLVSGFVIGTMVGIDSLKPDLDVLRDDHGAQRVGMDVGVSEQMDVARGAAGIRSHLQHGHTGRRRNVSDLTLANARVPRLIDHGW